MGGSVIVQTCPMLLDLKYRVSGVAVLDVVEGWLWFSLSAGPLTGRIRFCYGCSPVYAKSSQRSARWFRQPGRSDRMAVRNMGSLMISLLTLFSVITNAIRNINSARVSVPSIIALSTSESPTLQYQWRTPLRSTAPYWSSALHHVSSRSIP